jgi:hypothetical protein
MEAKGVTPMPPPTSIATSYWAGGDGRAEGGGGSRGGKEVNYKNQGAISGGPSKLVTSMHANAGAGAAAGAGAGAGADDA